MCKWALCPTVYKHLMVSLDVNGNKHKLGKTGVRSGNMGWEWKLAVISLLVAKTWIPQAFGKSKGDCAIVWYSV